MVFGCFLMVFSIHSLQPRYGAPARAVASSHGQFTSQIIHATFRYPIRHAIGHHLSGLALSESRRKASEIVGNRRKDTLQREAPLDAVPDTGGQYRVYTDGSKPIFTRKIIWAYRNSSENCRKPIGNRRKPSETVGNPYSNGKYHWVQFQTLAGNTEFVRMV